MLVIVVGLRGSARRGEDPDEDLAEMKGGSEVVERRRERVGLGLGYLVKWTAKEMRKESSPLGTSTSWNERKREG